jgi:hypothetical protein
VAEVSTAVVAAEVSTEEEEEEAVTANHPTLQSNKKAGIVSATADDACLR